MKKVPQERLTKRQRLMRKRKKRRRRILIAELVILVLLIGGVYVGSKLDMINFSQLIAGTNALDEETRKLMEGYTTIAVFGVDNRSNGDYDTGNSDVIMLANINNETKEVKLVSVYRDTAMDVDGDGTLQKCNYAYNHGGPDEAVEMLNRNLDLDIDGYVAVDFYALAGVVDALGGLEIELTDEEAKWMNEAYIHFLEQELGRTSEEVTGGLQTLDGIQTVAYCRVRYTAGDDFKRAERQRLVLSLLVDKVKKMNVFQMNDLINAVFPNVATSFNLSQILGMASVMRDYELTETRGYPFAMHVQSWKGRGDMVVPCTMESNIKQLHQYLFGEEDYQPTSTVQEISDAIYDRSGLGEEDALNYGY